MLLQPHAAVFTGAAGIDITADRDFISYLEFSYRFSCGSDHSSDFVAWNHGKNGAAPFVARLVNIRVANSTKLYVDGDVVITRLATFERKWRKHGFDGLRGIAFGFSHKFCSYRQIGLSKFDATAKTIVSEFVPTRCGAKCVYA
jgi:hypothetical protein